MVDFIAFYSHWLVFSSSYFIHFFLLDLFKQLHMSNEIYQKSHPNHYHHYSTKISTFFEDDF